jgi:hypothetical protein
LSLLESSVTSYTAAVEGGIPCFGDLYENGTSKGVTIDVQAGEKIMIRKNATNCKVIYTSISFGDLVATSDTGLLYAQDAVATFSTSERSLLRLKVTEGLSGESIGENLNVALEGTAIDGDDIDGSIENSELFVSTSGSAYAAPAVVFKEGGVKFFNSKVYAGVMCSGQEEAGGCKDSTGKSQKLDSMQVWVTNSNIESVPVAERFDYLESNFEDQGVIRLSTVPGLEGLQLMGSDGSMGIAPSTFNINDTSFFMVVRLQHTSVNSYKVFKLNKAPQS